jgi:hypothetical protein
MRATDQRQQTGFAHYSKPRAFGRRIGAAVQDANAMLRAYLNGAYDDLGPDHYYAERAQAREQLRRIARGKMVA